MKDFLKYLLAVVLGLMICGVLKCILFFTMVGALVGVSMGLASSSPAEVKSHSVYELDLRGSIAERNSSEETLESFMALMDPDYESKLTLDNVLRTIRQAGEDDRIEGILLRVRDLQCGYATAEAIRDALKDFRSQDKWVIAYADNYSQRGYYIASVADEVTINPIGSLSIQGMGATLEFYSRLMQKLGVKMQVLKVGQFKSAVEPYVLTKMSAQNREQYRLLLGDMWTVIAGEIAESRSLSMGEMNHLAQTYMSAQPTDAYLECGLVDALCYTQDVDSMLTARLGEDYTKLTYTDMCSLPESMSLTDSKIAVLYAEGTITDDKGDGIVGKRFVKTIDELRKDEDVKAVVLRVNSPGGSAFASEQIHHALSLLKATKPLIVSMGDYAASGGYYISCLADYIYAEPTTLTGSIGIYGLVPDVSELTGKVGLDFDTISTHRHANMDQTAVLYGMTPEEQAMMQREVNRGYELFTLRCAEGRGMTQDAIKAIAEGHVWSGVRAVEVGLVDSLGNMDHALARAARMAELTDYELVAYPKDESIFSSFSSLSSMKLLEPLHLFSPITPLAPSTICFEPIVID